VCDRSVTVLVRGNLHPSEGHKIALLFFLLSQNMNILKRERTGAGSSELFLGVCCGAFNVNVSRETGTSVDHVLLFPGKTRSIIRLYRANTEASSRL